MGEMATAYIIGVACLQYVYATSSPLVPHGYTLWNCFAPLITYQVANCDASAYAGPPSALPLYKMV